MLRALAVSAVLSVLFGCSSDDTSSDGTGGSAGSAGSSGSGGSAGSSGSAGASGSAGSAGSAACTLENVETIADEPTHVVERFSYLSEGLRIHGELCRPVGPGPFPVLIWNHGGFQGIGAGDRAICAGFAQNAGWATFVSEYRGEGGSEGAVEVCLGEADDVLALTECARSQAYADPARVLMVGGSHGGCITLRAVQRGAPVAAAVDIFGPSDWKAEHAFWTAELAAAPTGPLAATYQLLIDVMEQAAGGTPAQAAAEYDARSPLGFASDLTTYAGSLLMVHGVEDILVPPEQSCALADASGGFEARHYDATATTPLSTPPSGCEGSSLSWLTTPKPSPSWPGTRHVVIYDGADHALDASVPGQAAMVDDMLTFLAAKLPP